MPSDDLTTAAAALQSLHVEALLVPVLLQLLVIVAVARVAGVLVRKVGQPAVVGSIRTRSADPLGRSTTSAPSTP